MKVFIIMVWNCEENYFIKIKVFISEKWCKWDYSLFYTVFVEIEKLDIIGGKKYTYL